MAGLLVEAAHANDTALLQPISERFLAAAAAIERSRSALPEGPANGELAGAIEDLLSLGLAEHGVFSQKSRLLGDAGFGRLARVLRDGAELRIATDHVGYLRWILERMRKRTDFEWTARRSADWKTRPADWPDTRYEAKAAREGRPSTYLRLVRTVRP